MRKVLLSFQQGKYPFPTIEDWGAVSPVFEKGTMVELVL
jgi:hypothetical protein